MARWKRPAPPRKVPSATQGEAGAAGGHRSVQRSADRRERPYPNGARPSTLALDGEAAFTTDQLENPARLVVDLADTRILHSLKDRQTCSSPMTSSRQIRVARRAASLEVVFDLTGAIRPSVYPGQPTAGRRRSANVKPQR